MTKKEVWGCWYGHMGPFLEVVNLSQNVALLYMYMYIWIIQINSVYQCICICVDIFTILYLHPPSQSKAANLLQYFLPSYRFNINSISEQFSSCYFWLLDKQMANWVAKFSPSIPSRITKKQDTLHNTNPTLKGRSENEPWAMRIQNLMNEKVFLRIFNHSLKLFE